MATLRCVVASHPLATLVICCCLLPQCQTKRTNDAATSEPCETPVQGGAGCSRATNGTSELEAMSTKVNSESVPSRDGSTGTQAPTVTQELSASEKRDFERAANQSIAYRLDLMRRMRRMRPTAVPLDSLSPFVKVNSDRWMEKFLRPEALPSRSAAEVKYSAYPKGPVLLDTLITTWTWNGMRLRAFQDYAVVVLFIETPLQGSGELHSRLSAVGTSMLRTPITLEKRTRTTLEGEAFSTAPYVYINSMPSWAHRIDAGTLDGAPFFILYKRIAQLGAFHGPEWFPAEFRKQLKLSP
jgi:hypothetical protein